MSMILAGLLKGVATGGARAAEAEHQNELIEGRLRLQNELSKQRELSLLQLRQQFNADTASTASNAEAEQRAQLGQTLWSDPHSRRELERRGVTDPSMMDTFLQFVDPKELFEMTPEGLVEGDVREFQTRINSGLLDAEREQDQLDTIADARTDRHLAPLTGETAAITQDTEQSTLIELGYYDRARDIKAGDAGAVSEAEAVALFNANDRSFAQIEDTLRNPPTEENAWAKENGFGNLGSILGYDTYDFNSTKVAAVDISGLGSGPADTLMRQVTGNAIVGPAARAFYGDANSEENFLSERRLKHVEMRASRVFREDTRLSGEFKESMSLANLKGAFTGDSRAMEKLEALRQAMLSEASSSRRVAALEPGSRAESRAMERFINANLVAKDIEQIIVESRLASTKLTAPARDGGRVKNVTAPVASFNRVELGNVIRNETSLRNSELSDRSQWMNEDTWRLVNFRYNELRALNAYMREHGKLPGGIR